MFLGNFSATMNSVRNVPFDRLHRRHPFWNKHVAFSSLHFFPIVDFNKEMSEMEIE